MEKKIKRTLRKEKISQTCKGNLKMRQNQSKKLNNYANKLEKLLKEIDQYVLKVTNNPFNFSTPSPQNLRDLAERISK